MVVALGQVSWSLQAVQVATNLGFIAIALGMVLCLGRLVRGPRLADRAIALDTIAIHLIGLVILFTLQLDSLVLYDGVLVLSLLGFAGTVAVSQFIVRPQMRGRRRTWRTRAPVKSTGGAR